MKPARLHTNTQTLKYHLWLDWRRSEPMRMSIRVGRAEEKTHTGAEREDERGWGRSVGDRCADGKPNYKKSLAYEHARTSRARPVKKPKRRKQTYASTTAPPHMDSGGLVVVSVRSFQRPACDGYTSLNADGHTHTVAPTREEKPEIKGQGCYKTQQ